jgi:hypothetical protein
MSFFLSKAAQVRPRTFANERAQSYRNANAAVDQRDESSAWRASGRRVRFVMRQAQVVRHRTTESNARVIDPGPGPIGTPRGVEGVDESTR